MDLKFSIDEPEHGWVPCTLNFDHSVYEFKASDVPNNPIQEIIDCLFVVLRGESAEVWWHLEPEGYFFELKPIGNKLELRVLFSSDSRDTNKKLLSKSVVETRSTLLILWRSIKMFSSFDIKEPHWPRTDFSKLAELRTLILDLEHGS